MCPGSKKSKPGPRNAEEVFQVQGHEYLAKVVQGYRAVKIGILKHDLETNNKMGQGGTGKSPKESHELHPRTGGPYL